MAADIKKYDGKMLPQVQRIVYEVLLEKYVCYRDWETDRKSTRLKSSHSAKSRMPSSA